MSNNDPIILLQRNQKLALDLQQGIRILLLFFVVLSDGPASVPRTRLTRKIYTSYNEKSTKGTQMDETGENTESAVDETPMVHQFGRYVVGGLAAFAADKLATRAYDTAIRWNRARKSS